MTEPAENAPDGAAFITLGGKDWPVPVLAWRQLQKCRRELLELSSLINEAIAARPVPADADDDAHLARNGEAMLGVFRGLSNEDYDRLIMGPIFVGLTALHPTLGRDEFDSWSSGEDDRQTAWLAVRRQSGMFMTRSEAAPSGEAKGAPTPD